MNGLNNMNIATQYQLQNEINNAYHKCEQYKDEIALLTAMYKSSLVCLETLCSETGLTVTSI